MKPKNTILQCKKCLLLLCVVVVALWFIPLRYGIIRLGLVVGILGIWAGGLILFWRWWAARLLVGAVALLPVVLLFLPERPIPSEPLRTAYLHALKSYEGTPYVWGGETHTGIDCSGLLRQAMVDAQFAEGLKTGNGSLLRSAMRIWWYDCSAQALGEEYRNVTRRLRTEPDLNRADYSPILPGDLAVTASGAHILAYLGEKRWIQADPVAGKVVITQAPSESGWFIQEALIVRWNSLTP